MTIQERFDSKWTPEPFSGCHLWCAGEKAFGYGGFKFRGTIVRAHRVAWIIHNGEIPSGLHVLHHCDTRACVNPAHLFLGTNDDNITDCMAKGRKAIGAQHSNTKLTPEQVSEIRASSDSWSQLGARFGVHKGTIQGIKQNRHWRAFGETGKRR